MTYIMIGLGVYIFISLVWSGLFLYEAMRGQIHDPGWTKIFLWPLLIFELFSFLFGY